MIQRLQEKMKGVDFRVFQKIEKNYNIKYQILQT